MHCCSNHIEKKIIKTNNFKTNTIPPILHEYHRTKKHNSYHSKYQT